MHARSINILTFVIKLLDFLFCISFQTNQSTISADLLEMRCEAHPGTDLIAGVASRVNKELDYQSDP